MIASVIIISLSLAMLVYWFRCSCVLILESDWNEDQARVIASQNELSFSNIEESLVSAECASQMDQLQSRLDRDLKTVLTLMSNAGCQRETGQPLESRMLMLYYKALKLRYVVERTVAGAKARNVLREMSRVVAYLAGELGDQMAAEGA